MPLAQALRVLGKKFVDKVLVGKHGGEQMLSLGRDEAEARHLPSTADDDIVVRINNSNSKTREAHVFGQAIKNMDELLLAMLHLFNNLSDAGEGWGFEDSGRVYFIAY